MGWRGWWGGDIVADVVVDVGDVGCCGGGGGGFVGIVVDVFVDVVVGVVVDVVVLMLVATLAILGPNFQRACNLEPSWGHLGAILGPFWAQVGWKNVPTWLHNFLVKSISQVSKSPARWRLVGVASWILIY